MRMMRSFSPPPTSSMSTSAPVSMRILRMLEPDLPMMTPASCGELNVEKMFEARVDWNVQKNCFGIFIHFLAF